MTASGRGQAVGLAPPNMVGASADQAWRRFISRWRSGPRYKEYKQVSTLTLPGTPVSDQLPADPVVDFRSDFDASRWASIWEGFYCVWRELWFNQRSEPPSRVIGDEAIAAGAKGMLFESRCSEAGTDGRGNRYMDDYQRQ